jgi:hypothetical protein
VCVLSSSRCAGGSLEKDYAPKTVSVTAVTAALQRNNTGYVPKLVGPEKSQKFELDFKKD